MNKRECTYCHEVGIFNFCCQLTDALATVARQKVELEQAERDWNVEADARKMREEQIEAIAAELRSDAEWTSACDLGWHTRDLAGFTHAELVRRDAQCLEMQGLLQLCEDALEEICAERRGGTHPVVIASGALGELRKPAHR